MSAISIGLLKQLVQFLKKIIPQKMAELRVDCLRVTVKKNFDAGYKFVSLLGFCYAAELPNFYAGVDYQLFERRKI